MDHVVDERAEVAAERDAFAAFAERVEACPTPSPSSVASGSVPRAVTTRSDDAPDHAARLRRAYRETVMAVDHYDVVYDEPLVVNAAAELGPDAATVLDGGVPISSACKRTLHAAATRPYGARAVRCDPPAGTRVARERSGRPRRRRYRVVPTRGILPRRDEPDRQRVLVDPRDRTRASV